MALGLTRWLKIGDQHVDVCTYSPSTSNGRDESVELVIAEAVAPPRAAVNVFVSPSAIWLESYSSAENMPAGLSRIEV